MKLRKLLRRAVVPGFLIAATFGLGPYSATLGAQNLDAGDPLSQSRERSVQTAIDQGQRALPVYSDPLITRRVIAMLRKDRVTAATDIRVSTTGGIVTLKGTVPDSEALAHAELLARATRGVRNVVNELDIASASE